MSEAAQALAWVTSTAQADSALMAAATGGVWQGFAPLTTVAPYVLVSHQAATDVLTSAAVRLFTNIVLQIVAIGPSGNYAALITAADRIDALFKSQRDITLPGSGGVLASYREQALALDEIVNGIQYSRLGGLYRILLQGS